jgi:hypothetical protein
VSAPAITIAGAVVLVLVVTFVVCAWVAPSIEADPAGEDITR